VSKNSSTGQALSEYGMIAALIGVAAIGSLVLLGNNLQNSITHFLNAPTTADAPSSSGLNQSNLSQANLNQAGIKTGTPSGSDANASTLSLPPELQSDYQSFLKSGNISSLVETAGANGSSSVLLALMDNLITKKLAAGTITPEQANVLRQLSNKGHDIAAIEKLAEDKIQAGLSAGQTGADILAQEVQYNNQTHTVEDIYDLLGSGTYPAWGSGIDQATFNTLEVHEMTSDFYSAYLNIKDNNLVQDPETLQIVSYLSNQIAGLTEGVSENLFTMVSTPDAKPDPAFVARQAKALVQDPSKAELTDLNSAGLCIAGSGKDTGIHCQ
jgi:Flp pilus assembly pilin Flp